MIQVLQVMARQERRHHGRIKCGEVSEGGEVGGNSVLDLNVNHVRMYHVRAVTLLSYLPIPECSLHS